MKKVTIKTSAGHLNGTEVFDNGETQIVRTEVDLKGRKNVRHVVTTYGEVVAEHIGEGFTLEDILHCEGIEG